MSKLIRMLQSKVLNSKPKDLKKEEPTDLQVDAVPTKTNLTVVPRSEISPEPVDHHAAVPGSTNTTTNQSMNQANQFNSPSQTVYQFNHANGIHIGNNFTINQTNLQQDAQPLSDDDDEDNNTQTKDQKPTPVNTKLLRKKFPKTRTIELLLKSDQPLEHPDMDVIATHLGEDWRSVARDLGFSNGEIDHFYEDNFAYGVKEV